MRETVLLGLILCAGCKTAESAKALNQSAATQPIIGTAMWTFPFLASDALKCDEGMQLYTAGIKRIGASALAEVGFKGSFFVEPPDLALDQSIPGVDQRSLNYLARFDFCFDNADTFKLQRIIIQKKSEYSFGGLEPIFNVLTVTRPEVSSAFAKALFEQDYSQIDARFVGNSEWVTSYFVKGHTDQAGKSFLTISSFVGTNDPYLLTPTGPNSDKPAISVVELEISNPFASFEQPIDDNKGWQVATHAVQQDGIEFRFSYEVKLAPGGYRDYRYDRQSSLLIRENNPKLRVPIDLIVSKESIEAAMKFTASHHNLTDTFVFQDKERQATYTLSPGMADSGKLTVEYDAALGIPRVVLNIRRTLE
ncbi:MAG: hypothetical protein AB7T49_19320 [Oligoflexales bacterium]